MQEIAEKNKKSPTLFKKAIKGGWWIFGSRIVQQAMAMTRLVVLARFLSPSDFGLLGIAFVVISILNQFSTTGFNVALIQKKSRIDEYLNSAWTFGLIRGVVLYIILFAIAPLAAAFFETPEAVRIIRTIGVYSLLGALNNIGTVFFIKELDFKKQFIFINIGTFADITVAIVLAVIYRNVWALVAGNLVGATVRCIFSYVLHSFRPRLQLDRHKIAEMWQFGKHIMAGTILRFLCLEGDDIYLGKVLGPHVLGLYKYAYKVSNMMATEVGDLIGRVTFPAFSKLQDNIEKLRAGYIKSTQVVMLIVYPLLGGLIILAYELIYVVFGVEWMPMAPALQILCLLGVAKSNQGGSVLNSMNRPDVVVLISALRLAMIVITIYPLTKSFGMTGTAIAVTIPVFLLYPVQLYYVKQLIGHPMLAYVKLLSLPILATLCMMLTVFLARIFFAEVGLFTLGFLILVGASSYCVFVFGFSYFYKEYNIKEIIRNLAGGIK